MGHSELVLELSITAKHLADGMWTRVKRLPDKADYDAAFESILKRPSALPTLTFDGTSYDCAACGNRQVTLCEHWQSFLERAHAAITLGEASGPRQVGQFDARAEAERILLRLQAETGTGMLGEQLWLKNELQAIYAAGRASHWPQEGL